MSNEDIGLSSGPDEGPRLKGLKLSLNQATEKILGTCKYSTLAKCYPTFAKSNGKALDTIRAGAIEDTRKAIYKDMEVMLEEHVAQPLEELSQITRTYTGPKGCQAWRPPGNAKKTMLAHDIKVLQYEKQKLSEIVESLRKHSEATLKKVKAGREQIQSNSLKIQEYKESLQQVNDVCKTIPVEVPSANISDGRNL
ncbi:uncharacterized protein LOC143021911 [Oratosquilla oratoria]|uniref:uncharacterized protein LOC143021911 n=1 Tax=Oratosquilla oratoria TaxID=337810 RepID=UPI003F75E2E5